jgi:hypothetical protein
MTHYHIRWSTTSLLDWQRFETRPEAQQAAKGLVGSGETCEIEEVDTSCARCSAGRTAS